MSTEIYQQTARQAPSLANPISTEQPWLKGQTTVCVLMTPPSLVLTEASKEIYNPTETVVLVFNRRINSLPSDSLPLFVVTNTTTNTQVDVLAQDVILLSSEIALPNLVLVANATYIVNLAEARLSAFVGQVPCLRASISFATSSSTS